MGHTVNRQPDCDASSGWKTDVKTAASGPQQGPTPPVVECVGAHQPRMPPGAGHSSSMTIMIEVRPTMQDSLNPLRLLLNPY